MLTDLSALNGQAFQPDTYDVVIAGAGPAGITLARKLSAGGKRVALLEGGGLSYTQESQDVYSLSEQSNEFTRMYFASTRLRFFGGTSNHWAGRCSPMRELDFTERSSAYKESGWPVSLAEIQPYLAEARDILDVSTPEEFPITPGTVPMAKGFEPDVAIISAPTRFGTKYLDEVQNNSNIDLFINANLVDIRLTDDLTATAAYRVRNYAGDEYDFTGQDYILALGAIENARLMLASNSQLSDGVGNAEGMVGACYMDHYNITMGEFVANYSAWGDANRMSYFTTRQFSEANDIGSSNVTIKYGSPIKTYGNFAGVKKFLATQSCRMGMEGAMQKLFPFHCSDTGLITTLTEQEPSRSNRVVLTEETDALGLPKAKVEWSLTDFDQRTIREIAKEMAVQMTEAGLGRVQLPEFITDESLEIPFYGHAHHLGTTRMAQDAIDGVVNTDCKVFGNDNLYVAGSSIFPRGGGHNPTMPLVQFALRLSDHLLAVDESPAILNPS
ncbi:GMC family oxidoreductase [Halioxenophilus aromaticivorans]|uniref:GMC family oxidoreductase n=1 Tax=Halioxenophilus aromaticivorans TaxID=1306992 RepID=A0AAV3U155_9ALTE